MSNTENGLVLHLKMDEIINNDQALDSSNTGNDGTLIGNVTLSSDTTFENCFTFDGNTSYVNLGDFDAGGALAQGSTTFSVMGWVKPSILNSDTSNHGNANVFFSRGGDSVNDNFELGITPSGNLRVYIDLKNDDHAGDEFGSGELTVDNWHYVAVIFDSGVMTVYIDGKVYTKTYADGATALDQDTNTPMVIGGTTNSDIFFTGNLSNFRIYDQTLTTDEILEIVESDPVASASFRVSYPLDFSLTDEQGDQTLYIDDDPSGLDLDFTVSNSAEQTIELTAGTGIVGAANHHFELVFRPGTLSDSSLSSIAVSEENWDLTYATGSDGTISLYFLSTVSVNLETDGSLTLTLTSISADPGTGTRGTKVEFNYQQMVYSGESTELVGTRVQTLSVVNHTGEKYIPLHVGFIGSNTVLNDGAASSSVTLRITNISGDSIALSTSDPTKLIFTFDVGSNEEKPWALTSSDNTENIVLSTPLGWSISEDKSGESPVWTLSNDSLIALESGAHIELTLSGIVTDLDSGPTNLYLHYENVPGYWDGEFVVSMAKAPILYRGDNVGIGVSDPLIPLAIGGSQTGLKSRYDNSVSIYTDGVERLHFGSAGNIGVNTNSPSDKICIADGGVTFDTDSEGLSFPGGSKISEQSGILKIEKGTSTIDINLDTNTIVGGNIDLTGNASVGGSTEVSGTFTAKDAGSFEKDLSVLGNTTISGKTTMSGDASLSGTFTSDLATDGNLTSSKNLTVSKNASISGNTTLSGNLLVEGTLGKLATGLIGGSKSADHYVSNGGYKQLGNFMIQWGTCYLKNDHAVTYTFPKAFASSCWSIVLTRKGENLSKPINVSSFNKSSFSVNRDGDIDNVSYMTFFAVGDCNPEDI